MTGPPAAPTTLVAASLADVVRLYGLPHWVEQSYKQVRQELGWADFQVRSDRAIRRHWCLVCCAFSFCWWAYVRHETMALIDTVLEVAPTAQPPESVGGKPAGVDYVPRYLLSWPVALRQVQSWLAPWTMLWRWWRAWSTAPPPPAILALLDALDRGRSLPLFLPI